MHCKSILLIFFAGNTDVYEVLEIGKVAKEAVMKEGFLAWQYNTIGVSDGITMGHNGEYVRHQQGL